MLDSGLSLNSALRLSPDFDQGKLEFAISAGAPLAPLLRQLDRLERNLWRAQGELNQALAVPKATRAMLSWMPAVSLIFAQFLGLTTLAALTNPLVVFCLLLGLSLLIVGSRITAKQIAQASEVIEVADLQDFLVAVSAGMTLGKISRLRPELMESSEVSRLVSLSVQTGAALIPLIEGAIEASLENQLSRQIEKLRQLSVRILIPLGLTTLPAFLLFTIPPILVGSLR